MEVSTASSWTVLNSSLFSLVHVKSIIYANYWIQYCISIIVSSLRPGLIMWTDTTQCFPYLSLCEWLCQPNLSAIQILSWNRQADIPAPYPALGLDVLMCSGERGKYSASPLVARISWGGGGGAQPGKGAETGSELLGWGYSSCTVEIGGATLSSLIRVTWAGVGE